MGARPPAPRQAHGHQARGTSRLARLRRVQTDWENDEAVAFLQHRFDRCGLDLQLAKAGAVNGDEIRILGFAFTYEGEGADDEYSEVNEAEEELFADSDDVEGQE